MMESASYAAFKACGCMVAASVIGPTWMKETARDVRGWQRDGLTVQVVDTERVRKELAQCPHKDSAA